MTTTESNKLIAEFMGDFELIKEFKPEPDVDVTYCWKQLSNKGYGYDTTYWTDYKSGCIYHDRVCYNISWDWLMPVVEKIQMLDIVSNLSIGSSYVCLETTNQEDEWNQVIYADDRPIDKVWLLVVEFIKWYNNNNK